MTEPSPAGLDEAAALLAQAWSKRSPGERAAFAGRLAAASAPRDLPEDGLKTARERAALSGALAPADLVRGLDRDRAAQVLDLLAPEFDRMQDGGRWEWILRAAPRQDTLARLAAAGNLPAALDQVAGLPTDPAGEALRALAATGTVPDTDHATTVQALAWAQPLGGFAGDLAEAQRQAAIESLRASYDVLVQYGVFGRRSELDRLRAFAEEEAADPFAPLPLLPVTGIGGAGKSTVLGSLIRPYLDRIAAGDPAVPAVVVIDFDRLLFRPDAELQLSFELTRQLGLAAPAAAADFSAQRYQVRAEQQQSGSETFGTSVHVESSVRQASGFEREAGLLVQMHELDRRPVLLVLDTFEEWQREQPDPDAYESTWYNPERRILGWISRVRNEMGLTGLRVIVCGRAGLTKAETRPPLRIGDLPAGAAGALLKAIGVDERDTGTLVSLVGRNPLTLHIAARFYLGLLPKTRRSFLAGDGLTSDALSGDLRRAVLYDRFLEHIADDRVRKLAHPGLVLRRVTPDLVQHVLAAHCGLGKIDHETARQLTARLADEVWLVRKTTDGLHHRPDVRGPMLKLMSEDPEYGEVARQIHAAAVRWYRDGRDPVLPRQAAELEAFYHSLMLQAGDEPLPAGSDRVRLARALGPAVSELRPKVAAQVRVLRGDQIRDQDAPLLPDPLWQQWISRRGADLVNEGRATAALVLLDARQAVPPVRAEPAWLAQAYSDAARWDEYWPVVRRFGAPPPDVPAVSLESGRYAMLNALLSPGQPDLDDYENALMEYLHRASPKEPPSDVSERLFLQLLCSLGVTGGPLDQPPGTPWNPPSAAVSALPTSARRGREQGVIDLYPVDQLRRIMVWIAGGTDAEQFVIDKPAALCRPDPRWMKDFARFTGTYNDTLNSYVHRLETLTAGASSHELLGEWTLRYTRAMGSDQIVLNRSEVRRAAPLIRVLRGDNPELRPAILLALTDVVVGPKDMAYVGAVASSLLPVPAADLAPSALEDRRSLVQLVEYVDRSGVMGQFLAEVRRTRPGSTLLRKVSEAFVTWDRANRRLLDALGRMLGDE